MWGTKMTMQAMVDSFVKADPDRDDYASIFLSGGGTNLLGECYNISALAASRFETPAAYTKWFDENVQNLFRVSSEERNRGPSEDEPESKASRTLSYVN